MARGTSLGVIVDKVRAEARHSQNPALGTNVRATIINAIQRVQNQLYLDYDWPFLRVRRDKLTQAGQRYYDFPTDLNLERVETFEVLWGTEWRPIENGIEMSDYTTWNSDLDVRVDPVRKWQMIDAGAGPQYEIWPLPATNDNTMRWTGIRKLQPLVADSDRADLDDDMIALFVAAEFLAHAKQYDAKAKLSAAQGMLERLRSRMTLKRRSTDRLSFANQKTPESGRPRILVAYAR